MHNAKCKILLFSFLLTLLVSCNESPSFPPPLKFKVYEQNPILSPGEPGSWDDLFLWVPQVVHDDGTFYLFYLGGNQKGRMAVGLATSSDGFLFTKYGGNPVLSPDNAGFDAFTVGPGIVLKKDSIWIMYYNAQEMIVFAPGPHSGMAMASSPFGPWVKSEAPVISSGGRGEWDAGFILPSSVLLLDDGSFMMYYSGGVDVASFNDFYIGMALSEDGINWKKYNNPETREHPYLESDPVMMPGREGEWDGEFIWMPNVTRHPDGFRMYYSASQFNSRKEFKAIGYATSRDGIHWEKYSSNPVFRAENDSFIRKHGGKGFLENPSLIYLDSICLMYYEFGPFQPDSCFLGVATAIPVDSRRSDVGSK